MTGTIVRLERDRGTGVLLGIDGKEYLFRRRDLCDGWFHELTEGAPVTFDPEPQLSARQVRVVRTAP